MVLGDLLQPDRAARLEAFSDRQPNALTLPEVVTGPHAPESPMQALVTPRDPSARRWTR